MDTPSTEQARHNAAIEQLCDRYPQHHQEIPTLYSEKLAEIPDDVRIRAFLSIFISRAVQQALRDRDDQLQH